MQIDLLMLLSLSCMPSYYYPESILSLLQKEKIFETHDNLNAP